MAFTGVLIESLLARVLDPYLLTITFVTVVALCSGLVAHVVEAIEGRSAVGRRRCREATRVATQQIAEVPSRGTTTKVGTSGALV